METKMVIKVPEHQDKWDNLAEKGGWGVLKYTKTSGGQLDTGESCWGN